MLIVKGTSVWPAEVVSAVSAVSKLDAAVIGNGQRSFTVMIHSDFDRLPHSATMDVVAQCAIYAYEDRILESLSPMARSLPCFTEADDHESYVSHVLSVDSADVSVVQALLAADVAEFIRDGAYIMMMHEPELVAHLNVALGEDTQLVELEPEPVAPQSVNFFPEEEESSAIEPLPGEDIDAEENVKPADTASQPS